MNFSIQQTALHVASYVSVANNGEVEYFALGGGLQGPIRILEARDVDPDEQIIWMDELGEVHFGFEATHKLDGFIKVDFAELISIDRQSAYFAAISNDPFNALPATRPICHIVRQMPNEIVATEDIFQRPEFSPPTVWLAVSSTDEDLGDFHGVRHFQHSWMWRREVVEARVGQGWFVPLGYSRTHDPRYFDLAEYYREIHIASLWVHVMPEPHEVVLGGLASRQNASCSMNWQKNGF